MPPKLSPAQRRRLIHQALKGTPISNLCQKAGISRPLFYRWLNRYKTKGN